MADAAKSIFNKRATDKLRSPDDLDKYVRVTNPSVWVLLLACTALLVGLLSWGIFGSVTTSIAAKGVSLDGTVMCFVSPDDAAKVHEGDVANVEGTRMTVASVSTVPLSRFETWEVLSSDYLVDRLVEDEWAYQVIFEGDASALEQGVPIEVRITTERVAPIELILGGGA